MKLDLKSTVIAGVAGTIAFDVAGLLLTGQWWDIPSLLGAKLGLGLAGGVVAHYGNGVLLALIYAAVAGLIPGPRWSRPFTFVSAHTVFGVWLFMLPLLDMGFAGLAVSAMIPVITLARHWAYASVLAVLDPSAGWVDAGAPGEAIGAASIGR